MKTDEWIGIATLGITFVGVLISFFHSKNVSTGFVSSKLLRLRENYAYFKANFADDRWKKMDDYSLASCYLALTGKRIEASILRYMLGKRESFNKIIDYHYGERFLKIKRNSFHEVICISLKELCGSVKARRYQVTLVTICFVANAVLILMPLLIKPISDIFSTEFEYTQPVVFISIVWSFMFSFLSVQFFLQMRDLWAAIRLTSELSEHNQAEASGSR